MSTGSQSKRRDAQAVETHLFEGADVWIEGEEHARLRGYFPLSPGTSNAGEVEPEDLMMVSMEIEPDDYLPTHRDSNEELLLVTYGTVDATVGDETVTLSTGQCAIVPEMVSHGLKNVGTETAYVVGVFPNTELTATFEKPMMPFETNVITIGGKNQP